MIKKKISWKKYYSLINKLSNQLKPEVKKGNINQIICLARGGLIIGDALSRKLNIPYAIMFTSSYTDKKRGTLHIGDCIAKQHDTLGDKIVIVDDLVDSGVTLEKIKCHLSKELKTCIKTAVIWKKETSLFVPDFYVKKMLPDQWIVQPFEIEK